MKSIPQGGTLKAIEKEMVKEMVKYRYRRAQYDPECGYAARIAEAFRNAHEADSQSIFGGIVALNKTKIRSRSSADA